MRTLIQKRHLLWQLVRRDLAGRYRDSLLGLAWLLLTPLFMLGVYSFVFGVVFNARWGEDTQSQAVPFALLLYSGLILHGLMAEILPQAVSLMRAHPNYIKKVVFPVEFLPLKITITAFSLFVAQWMLLVVASAWCGFYPTAYWLWLPMIIAPFILLLLGLAWLFAALGVFLPDLKHIMGLLMTVLLFISPIFYSIDRLPPLWQKIMLLNPLSFMVEAMRGVMFYAQNPNINGLLIYWALGLLVLVAGAKVFAKLKPTFSDVI